MIKDILDIARTLFGLRGKLREARRDRRDRIADYFDNISLTVQEVANSLKKDEIPHGKCEEMAVYADMLTDTVGDEIGLEKAQELSNRLKEAHEVELIIMEIRDDSDKESKIAQLEKASGLFKALANSIRAT